MFYDHVHQCKATIPCSADHVIMVLSLFSTAVGVVTVNDMYALVHGDIFIRWLQYKGHKVHNTMLIDDRPVIETSTEFVKMVHHIRRAFHIVKPEHEKIASHFIESCRRLAQENVEPMVYMGKSSVLTLWPWGPCYAMCEPLGGGVSLEKIYHDYGIGPVRYGMSLSRPNSTVAFSTDFWQQIIEQWRILSCQFEHVLDFNRWDTDSDREAFCRCMENDFDLSNVWVLFHQLLNHNHLQSCVSILKVLGLWDFFVDGERVNIPYFHMKTTMDAPVKETSIVHDIGSNMCRIELIKA